MKRETSYRVRAWSANGFESAGPRRPGRGGGAQRGNHGGERGLAILQGLVLCLVLLCGLPAAEAFGADDRLCVMTYNLRFASAAGPNSWPGRQPLMTQCIKEVSPDIIGTQEGVYGQLKDLAADLPEYDWIGLGREGGSKGEFMAVFYRQSRLEPLAFDHFWLSDTPNVIGSATWGNSVRRMVTWIRFKDSTTGGEFYLVNTHFDHQVQVAREKSASLLRQRVDELKTDLPVLVTGDFNAGVRNKAYEILTGDGFFADTWNTAKERVGEGLGTFNGFKEVPKNNTRIDWILSRGNVVVEKEEIITFNQEGKFPSDHCPLVAWVRLSK